MLLLLAAPAAVAAVRAMDRAGLLEPVLAVSGNVERLAKLAAIEERLGRAPDPVLRLAALIDGAEPEAIGAKLRLSRAEIARLENAGCRHPALEPHPDERPAQSFIYRNGVQAFSDGVLMAWARSGDDVRDVARTQLLRLPERWRVPELPVRGADVLARGVKAGPEVGRVIAAFESWWIAAGYPTDPKAIADKLDELIRD
jgi:tRNA nucleotidyltransferase/poly(A) polymerase